MLIGCCKEIKNNEYRVGLTPSMVKSLVSKKNDVMIEKGAGLGSGFSDANYIDAGARIVTTKEIFSDAELIIKVKEPQSSEREKLNSGQILFTYLHQHLLHLVLYYLHKLLQL